MTLENKTNTLGLVLNQNILHKPGRDDDLTEGFLSIKGLKKSLTNSDSTIETFVKISSEHTLLLSYS